SPDSEHGGLHRHHRPPMRMHTRSMRYWWASQGKNFQHVAHKGNLWTCPRAGGAPLRSRRFIKDLSPGDMVFHYGHGALRALSEVTASAVPFPRPEHYPPDAGEGDDGWLVESDPLLPHLQVPSVELASVLHHGGDRPLDVSGAATARGLHELRPAAAAHIVPRPRLTEDERRDLARIAMLACTLGCDSLFEHGYIAVDSTGTVQALSDAENADLTEFAQAIDGRHCTAHATATARRFADHYSRASRRRQDGSVHLW